MALAERSDPIAGFRFGVEIQGLVVGWFTECGGLTVERTVVPHEEGGVNDYVHQLPGPLKRTDITLKRGIADSALWDWFRQGMYDGRVTRRNLSVVLYSGDRTEAGRWDLTDAFPRKWTGPDLRAGETQVAVEALQIGQRGEGSGASLAQRRTVDGASAPQGAGPTGARDQQIDLPALAQKVYDLLRQELRWERERLGRHRPW